MISNLAVRSILALIAVYFVYGVVPTYAKPLKCALVLGDSDVPVHSGDYIGAINLETTSGKKTATLHKLGDGLNAIVFRVTTNDEQSVVEMYKTKKAFDNDSLALEVLQNVLTKSKSIIETVSLYRGSHKIPSYLLELYPKRFPMHLTSAEGTVLSEVWPQLTEEAKAIYTNELALLKNDLISEMEQLGYRQTMSSKILEALSPNQVAPLEFTNPKTKHTIAFFLKLDNIILTPDGRLVIIDPY